MTGVCSIFKLVKNYISFIIDSKTCSLLKIIYLYVKNLLYLTDVMELIFILLYKIEIFEKSILINAKNFSEKETVQFHNYSKIMFIIQMFTFNFE